MACSPFRAADYLGVLEAPMGKPDINFNYFDGAKGPLTDSCRYLRR